MPPRRLLLPKSNQSQPLESNEWNVDDFTANFILETSGPNIVNVSTANNGRPLRFAPAGFYGQSFGPAPGRGNSSAPDMQPSFPVRGPLTASTSQNDGAERLRQHLMSLRELSVARGLDNVEEVLEPDQSQIKCTSLQLFSSFFYSYPLWPTGGFTLTKYLLISRRCRDI